MWTQSGGLCVEALLLATCLSALALDAAASLARRVSASAVLVCYPIKHPPAQIEQAGVQREAAFCRGLGCLQIYYFPLDAAGVE